jgi:signal transduction histidine kinase
MKAIDPGSRATIDHPGAEPRGPRWLGSLVIGAVVVLSCTQHPGPALNGSGLLVAVALALLIGASSMLLLRADSPLFALELAALIVAASGLVWLQRGGAAEPALFVAVALAGTRLADRPSLTALALTAGAYLASAIHVHRAVGMIAGAEMGIIAFYLVARFARSAAESQVRASRLLLEIQASRKAEADAAMLRERSRIARDMHDVLAHSLSGLMLQLEGARMLAGQPDAGDQLPRALDRAHHLARAGFDEARRAISALRDEETLPGPDRLKQLAQEFEQDSQVATSFETDGVPRELDSETSLTIFRVAQEALTNVRRHASPARVVVSLNYAEDGIRLLVRDDMDAARGVRGQDTGNGGGYGLTGMRERAELLGGSLDARRTAAGFQVDLWLPA